MRLSCSLKELGWGLLRALVSSIHTFLARLGVTQCPTSDSSTISYIINHIEQRITVGLRPCRWDSGIVRIAKGGDSRCGRSGGS